MSIIANKYSKSIVEKEQLSRCGAVIFNKNFKKVLLVKNNYCFKWGFPKGSSLPFEDRKSCAIREVKEETGINLNNQGEILNFLKIDSCYYFVVHLKDKVKFDIEDKVEICDVKFIPINKIPDLYSNRSLKSFYTKYKNNIKDLTSLKI